MSNIENIVVNSVDSVGDRHGGLYNNMQKAFDLAQHKYLLMLQDDVQIVRRVDEVDFDSIERIFQGNPKWAFLSVLFLKSLHLKRSIPKLRANHELDCYCLPVGASQKLYEQRLAYSDVSLWHVPRLKAANWKVGSDEGSNVVRARMSFADMPLLKDPFVFFCPEVPFYRNRDQTIASRLAKVATSPHVKHFLDMSAQEIMDLRARPVDNLPVAEDWLTPNDPSVKKPFALRDVNKNILLSTIYDLEVFISNWRGRS